MAGKTHGTPFVHGTMDVRAQEKTFAGFIRMVMWGGGICIGVLIFLTLANS